MQTNSTNNAATITAALAPTNSSHNAAKETTSISTQSAAKKPTVTISNTFALRTASNNVNSIPIYYQNIRSIPAKNNLYHNLQTTIYDVICLTETWFTKDHKSETFIPSRYMTHRVDRNANNSEFNRGGGVTILVDTKYQSKRLQQFEDVRVEGMCIELVIGRNSFIVYIAYIPELETERDVAFQRHMACISKIVDNSTIDVLVLGDFNMRGVKWQPAIDSNQLTPYNISPNDKHGFGEFLACMQYLSFLQIVDISNDAGNFLDLVFTRKESLISVHHAATTLTNIKQTESPHPPIELVLNMSTMVSSSNDYVEVLAYSKGNYQRMMNIFNSINFAAEFHRRDVNEAFEYFYDVLNTAITNNIPTIKIKCNNNKPKWWNAELQRLKNKRNKEWKRSNGCHQDEHYINALNAFNELNETRYTNYVNDIQDQFKSNPSLFWKFARERTNSSNYPSYMSYKNTTADSPQCISNLFADCFQTFYSVDNIGIDLDSIVMECSNDANELCISMYDIENTIKELKINGAVGADGLSPKVFCSCSDALIWPLWILFHKTFESGIIPDRLKLSKIIPIHKKGDKSDVENYRMVAIGTMILQIFEKTVNNKLKPLIENKISPFQHGFRSRHSVSTNLLAMSIAAHDAFARGNQLDVFYGDFEKAFDKVHHRILLKKIVKFGLGANTIKWIASFLQNRGNYVQIGNNKSHLFNSTSGVGAGTSLGPLLFLMFIDDLASHSRCKGTKILLFADDVKMYREIATSNDTLKLRGDLIRLADWCNSNELKLNIDKCFIMSLRRTTYHIIADYKINNESITRVEEMRDLGVLVDNRMDFVAHIENSIASARQMFGYIKWLSGGRFHYNTLKLLYTSYVRSKLEFAADIWDPFRANYKSEIESVQKQFLLFLLGDNIHRPPYRIAPYVERCKLVQLQPLYTRRLIIKLSLAYEILMNEVDPYISMKLMRANNSRRSLRHQNILIENTYRNDYSYNQPIACIIRLINQHSECFLNAQTKNVFKSSICKKFCDFNEPDI